MKKIAFVAIAIILLTAFTNIMRCKESSLFYGTKWYLSKIYQTSGTQKVTSKIAFIEFNREKKSAGGNGGCNVFGGTLSVIVNKISISEMISTEMYCDGIQPAEDAFFEQLRKVNRFEIKDKTLLLYRDKEVLLEFGEK